jgi:hypothetical protein
MPEARRVRATGDEAHDLPVRRDEVVPADVLLDSRAQRSRVHPKIVRRPLRDYAPSRAMAGDVDAYSVDTSTGRLTVQYGWNRWVSVHARGSHVHKAVVANRRGLERLLAEAGVPEIEVRPLAARLWKDRPKSALRAVETDAWEGPWKRHPGLALVIGLLLLVAVAALGITLKTGIVFF